MALCRPDVDSKNAAVERSKVLFVGGVPPELDSTELLEHMRQYGPVQLVKRCKGYAYIKFAEPSVAREVQLLDHHVGGKLLTLQPPTATKKVWYCQLDPGYSVRVRRLGDGVFLVQNLVSMARQEELLKLVLDLGQRDAGFYTPTFDEHHRLQLEMFCMGRHWDCRTNRYSKTRDDHDGLPVLELPGSLMQLVTGILADIHQKCKQRLVPDMCPDICLVNRYNAEGGSLGLHQDNSESEASIVAGLPVISISLGNTGRFTFRHGTEGPEQSLLLRSGDVFVFGGPSRLLFHGVSGTLPGSAPRKLRECMAGEPCRVSLTFRQF